MKHEKDPYKVKIIQANLEKMKDDEYYLVRMKGDSGKAINLDEGALRLLLDHYSHGSEPAEGGNE